MPIETYPDQVEPHDENATIWRFTSLERFRDLIETSELYFCRADLFSNDEREGLPPEEYLKLLGLSPLDLRDRQQLLNQIGSGAQFRESFYVSCWHLFEEETCKMWKEYAEDGVAICSRYRLLRTALDRFPDRSFLGLMRYGPRHLLHPQPARWNAFRFIMSKRAEYAAEREVRALLWITDSLICANRHIDEGGRAHPRPLTPPPLDRVLEGHRRKVNLNELLTEIVVTPWGSSRVFHEICSLTKSWNCEVPVRRSDLAPYRDLLPHQPIAP